MSEPMTQWIVRFSNPKTNCSEQFYTEYPVKRDTEETEILQKIATKALKESGFYRNLKSHKDYPMLISSCYIEGGRSCETESIKIRYTYKDEPYTTNEICHLMAAFQQKFKPFDKICNLYSQKLPEKPDKVEMLLEFFEELEKAITTYREDYL